LLKEQKWLLEQLQGRPLALVLVLDSVLMLLLQ
jgi:hypothetical protein